MNILPMASFKDGLFFYRQYQVFAMLLEALADSKYHMTDNLFNNILTHIAQEKSWNAKASDLSDSLTYLTHIGMIETGDDIAVRITNKGLEALADCRFQQLASSAFFNYRSIKNNGMVIIFALFSLFVALAVVLQGVKP